MLPGDFTTLADAYLHRPAYSEAVIDMLVSTARAAEPGRRSADVGAGTGKLTAMLDARGVAGTAVEPNAAMRAQGERLALPAFVWREGRAEATGLEGESVDLATMASAFHWADATLALREFHRILKPGGVLALLWNPRDLDRDARQARIEQRIKDLVPEIKRRSSGAPAYTERVETQLLDSGLFGDLIFLEAPHVERMTAARHLGAWESVNDIRAQAGEARWAQILSAIREELGDSTDIEVRYRTRAWLVRRR
jgi:ubiquinone/menaquinone biosynthesis C-methylase UbiE